MKNDKYFRYVLYLFFISVTLPLRSQDCYENLVAFKADLVILDSFQLKCLDYNLRIFRTFKEYDGSSKLKLIAHTCGNDLLKNHSIGNRRLDSLSHYGTAHYSIDPSDMVLIDKSDTVRIGFCSQYGGVIEFQITMTKPLSGKLGKKLKKIKLN